GLVLSHSGASIRCAVPLPLAAAFCPMFAIGGLTGLPLGLTASDIYLHDTFYVIGHFHYVVAPGTIFALFAGIYYWYPKVTGKQMNQTLARSISGSASSASTACSCRCSGREWRPSRVASTTRPS